MGTVTRAQAVRLAISAMQAERQRLAAQANLYTRAGCDTPGTRAAAQRRDQLDAAIVLLQQPEQERMRIE